jgi:hypothetical protein
MAYTALRMLPLASILIVDYIYHLITNTLFYPIENALEILLILGFPWAMGHIKNIHPDHYKLVDMADRAASIFYWPGDLLIKAMGKKLPILGDITFPIIRLQGKTLIRSGQNDIPMLDPVQSPKPS